MDIERPLEPATLYAAARAVFVQTNNTSGNEVVAYHRADDGSLSRWATYETGGLGSVLEGSVADHLASQGSLTYSPQHRLLFAVNAGSSTVTVFSVDRDSLHRIQIISSGGTFPVSVTVHHDRAYVLNARDGGSIQGYRLTADGLQRVTVWRRDLHLDTTGDPEFTHTSRTGHLPPDGSRLVVTTKAGGSSILVFPLGRDGEPAAGPAVTSREDSVPFGMTLDRERRLVVADTGAGPVDSAISPDFNHLYVETGGEGSVDIFRIQADGSLTKVETEQGPDAVGGEGIVAL